MRAASEGDLKIQSPVEPMDSSIDHIADEGSMDPDFKAFLEEQFVSPSAAASLDDPNFASNTPLSHSLFPEPVPGPYIPNSAALHGGLLHSPGTAHWRKRKYGFVDHAEVARGTPSRLSQEFEDVTSGPGTQGLSPQAIQGPIRTCKVPGGSALKTSLSGGLGSTMPFSLVKKFPSTDSLSLEDINNRIQNLAKNPDSNRTPTNSNTSNSTQLNHISPPNSSKRGSKRTSR